METKKIILKKYPDTASLFSLDGKTAIVTGAAGYFGDSFCRALLDFGANVVLMGRGEKILDKTKEYEEEGKIKP